MEEGSQEYRIQNTEHKNAGRPYRAGGVVTGEMAIEIFEGDCIIQAIAAHGVVVRKVFRQDRRTNYTHQP